MIKRIRQHKVMCSDIMKVNFGDIMEGNIATYMYSDPPWGDGNIKFWHTLNKKATGEDVTPSALLPFLDVIFSIARDYVKEIIWLEYGIRWRSLIIDYAYKYNLLYLNRIDSQYRSGSRVLPYDLHILSHRKIDFPAGYKLNVSGQIGYETVRRAVTPFAQPGKIIIDPCCGMGYTAQIAIDTGMIFYGNELNQKRLDKTIQRLK